MHMSFFYQVIAIGWGVKAEHDNRPSEELQQVTLQSISYENDFCGSLVNSEAEQFCAGVENGGKGKYREFLSKKV